MFISSWTWIQSSLAPRNLELARSGGRAGAVGGMEQPRNSNDFYGDFFGDFYGDFYETIHMVISMVISTRY